MSIYRDLNEDLDDEIATCPNLEAATGADVLISPSNLPCASGLLLEAHVRKFRAVLVQVKRGSDLTASIGGRLLGSLARMRAFGADKNQCLLVSTGLWLPDGDGFAIPSLARLGKDGRPYVLPLTISGLMSSNQMLMQSLSTALAEWALLGGGYVPLHDDSALLPFLQRLERLLIQAQAEPEKHLYPEVARFPSGGDKPFREIKLVQDGRSILAALPGIGPVRAQACFDQWGEAADALPWLSTPELYDEMPEAYPRGIGRKTLEKVKAALGGSLQRVPSFAEQATLAEATAERE